MSGVKIQFVISLKVEFWKWWNSRISISISSFVHPMHSSVYDIWLASASWSNYFWRPVPFSACVLRPRGPLNPTSLNKSQPQICWYIQIAVRVHWLTMNFGTGLITYMWQKKSKSEIHGRTPWFPPPTPQRYGGGIKFDPHDLRGTLDIFPNIGGTVHDRGRDCYDRGSLSYPMLKMCEMTRLELGVIYWKRLFWVQF